jgi:GNAT superfamily N-acetyltransferase
MIAVASPSASVRLPGGLSLFETRDATILQAVFSLRVRAWRARNASFPDIEAWRDSFDETGRHWVVVDAGGEPVAAARLTVHATLAEAPDAAIYGEELFAMAGPVGSINRLVVASEYGGKGLTRWLDETRVAAARLAGCRFMIGATRAGDRRIESARQLGFEVVGQAGPYVRGPLAITEGLEVILLKLMS